MVYVLLVGLLTVFLVAFSYRVDKGKRDQGIMVNSILLLFTYTLCNFLSLVMVNYFSNYTITYILAQMSEILENLFILNFCVNIMVFPALKKHKLLTPICEVRRWFRILFGGRARRSARELRVSTTLSEEKIDRTGELMEKIGLSQ